MNIIKRGEEVPLDKLNVPGEVAKLARDPTLSDMRFSINEIGMLHPIIYRKRDQRLLTGRKRIASAIRLGLRTVPVTWVECTDNEAEIVEESENAYRIHDRAAQSDAITRLVALRTHELKVSGADQVPNISGRRRSAHAIAITETAEVTGKSEQAVRQAEWRSRKRKKEKANPKPKPQKPALEIQKLGVEPDDALYESATKVAALIDRAVAMLEKTKPTMAEISQEVGPGFWVPSVSEVIKNLETCRPASVCPYCKSLDGFLEKCEHCRRRGWVTQAKLNVTPKELLDETDPCVLVDGRIVSAYEATEQQKDGKEVPDWM